MEYYINPKGTKYLADFDGWNFDFDINKTIAENSIRAAKIATDEFVTGMSLHLETDFDDFGSIVLSSEAFDEAFFHFCLADIVVGAVNMIKHNYGPRFREEKKSVTINHLKKLRALMLENVSIVDKAIENPCD